MQLNVGTAGPGTAQRVVRIEFGRIDGGAGLRQPNRECIIHTWLADVLGPHDKVDVTVQVRLGGATNVTGTGRLARLGVGARVAVEVEVCRDAGPVNVQVCAVVVVLQMAPGRRPVLAFAADAEVRLRTRVADDETAAGQEVTRRAQELAEPPAMSTNAASPSRLITLRIVLPPLVSQATSLVNSRGRGPDDHVGDALDDDMEGIHDRAGQ